MTRNKDTPSQLAAFELGTTIRWLFRSRHRIGRLSEEMSTHSTSAKPQFPKHYRARSVCCPQSTTGSQFAMTRTLQTKLMMQRTRARSFLPDEIFSERCNRNGLGAKIFGIAIDGALLGCFGPPRVARTIDSIDVNDRPKARTRTRLSNLKCFNKLGITR